MTNPVLPVEPVGRAVGAMSTLSFVGGFVDVVGFGLFTAHVTGNFIMIGLEMVHATELAIAKLLAGRSLSCLTRLFVLHYEKRGRVPLAGDAARASGSSRRLHDWRRPDHAA